MGESKTLSIAGQQINKMVSLTVFLEQYYILSIYEWILLTKHTYFLLVGQ